MTKLLTLDDLARAILVHNTDGLTFEREPEIVQTALRGTARAILTTIKEAGYAIVPVEPDDDTLEAGQAVANAAYLDQDDIPGDAYDIWKVMLSKSPQIEGE